MFSILYRSCFHAANLQQFRSDVLSWRIPFELSHGRQGLLNHRRSPSPLSYLLSSYTCPTIYPAYFLCAQYQHSSPSSQNKSPSKRPKLRNSLPKPLSSWDNVYYAELAVIRQIYEDLQSRFGVDFGGGTNPVILHNADQCSALCGERGNSRGFTVTGIR